MYHFYDFDEAYDYLVLHGGYGSDSYLKQKPDEEDWKYSARILSIANRIYECMEQYPKEIFAFCKAHPEGPQYSFQQLSSLNYKDLAEIRTSLGIKKRRKKAAKKVVAQEPAKNLAEQAREVVDNTSTRDLAAQVICNAQVAELDEPETETILSLEELKEMYGEDLPSTDYLMRMGIIPEYPAEYEEQTRFEIPDKHVKTKKPRA